MLGIWCGSFGRASGGSRGLDDPDHVFKEAAFTVEIVDAMKQVPRVDVPVVSRDGKLNASNLQTIW